LELFLLAQRALWNFGGFKKIGECHVYLKANAVAFPGRRSMKTVFSKRQPGGAQRPGRESFPLPAAVARFAEPPPEGADCPTGKATAPPMDVIFRLLAGAFYRK